MWMSFGGMIGGIAAGLIAPYVFNWIAEYPILIALAVLCRPGFAWPQTRSEQLIFFGAIVFATVALIVFRRYEQDIDLTTYNAIIGALLVVTVLFWRDPVPFAAIIAFVLLANHFVIEGTSTLTLRSFFGVHKITESGDGRFRNLSHGTTLHGGQKIRDAQGDPITERPEPTMYYFNGSAIAQAFEAARERNGGKLRYAVIGLGTGSMACRSQPQDTVTYYEIDPTSIYIARDSGMFTFLKECGQSLNIVLGDARLTLADAPDGSYDFILVDAFNSDAIPMHLLTREAMAIYLRKLSPNGMVAVHVSNRHLELASVVVGIAAANKAVARVSESGDVVEDDREYRFLATVVAVARTDEDFGPLAKSKFWELQTPDRRQWVWTDDYNNVVGALLRQMRQ
jgi:predicted O-methyltransferase YrrM